MSAVSKINAILQDLVGAPRSVARGFASGRPGPVTAHRFSLPPWECAGGAGWGGKGGSRGASRRVPQALATEQHRPREVRVQLLT